MSFHCGASCLREQVHHVHALLELVLPGVVHLAADGDYHILPESVLGVDDDLVVGLELVVRVLSFVKYGLEVKGHELFLSGDLVYADDVASPQVGEGAEVGIGQSGVEEEDIGEGEVLGENVCARLFDVAADGDVLVATGRSVFGTDEQWKEARAVLGERAAEARLLLFGTAFAQEPMQEARGRRDVELIDLERLYE